MSFRNITKEEIDRVYGVYPDYPTTSPVFLQIEDDKQIKQMLMQASRTAALEPRPELPVPMRYRVYWGDEKFFYCVTRFYGYPEDKDNGYVAYLIMRESCSVRDAHRIFTNLADTGASGPDVIDEVQAVKAEQN